MEPDAKIYLAGHKGMVGSAIFRLLMKRGFRNVLTVPRDELDLIDAQQVKDFFRNHHPDYLIMAAAKVGGISANLNAPVEFLLENMLIQNNLIMSAVNNGVKKIIFLGSSCIYPKECMQPMKEEYLLSGPLEPTNEGYALAKIAGLKLLEYYSREYGVKSLCLIPCNLYGTNDSFDLQTSHVLAALVRKFVDANDISADSVSVWGSGVARREFMHVDDFAEAMLFADEKWNSSEIINVGTGVDISIKELAELISSILGYKGKIVWDNNKPDGMLKKCLDVGKMTGLGYLPKIRLEEGIRGTVAEYRELRLRRAT